MLELDTKLKLDKEAVLSPDLCDRFSSEELKRIGQHVLDGYERDRRSRYKWERRSQAALDLAMQIQKDKSFPWPGCSNIAFPLVTIAALQFHSRAYPAIISGTDIVKCRVIGADDTGEKTERAKRISVHMSWQCLEEDTSWEEQKDRLLISLPIVGTVFTKSYYDVNKGYKVSDTVLAQDLVLDYWAKSVECCPRKTHIIPMFRNELHTGIAQGIYRDVSDEAWYQTPPTYSAGDEAEAQKNNRQGIVAEQTDETTPYVCLEQHVDLDLDQDGYAEPYIITIEESSAEVLRIVTGFDRWEDIERTAKGDVIAIRRMEYFTKYGFIPSPDGGIYDTGFGVLLGPLNESVNTMINQLVDAGTMSITAGGFLGRGAKIRGGKITFNPFEWNRVDSTGDDLSKNMVPLPVREPNGVLFQLLSLLINYVERLSGTTDPMVGENPGQNTTAETMRTMVQEGQRVYTAVFKRIWRCMKNEFKKGYILNGIYMPIRKSFGEGQVALREDYLGNPDEVAPAADPNIASEGMALQQIQLLKAAAASTPGYNMEEVEKRFLKALKIDNIEQIYPGVQKTGQPKDVKLQIAEMNTQVDMQKLQLKEQELMMAQQRWTIEMQEEVRLNEATIAKIIAEIETMKETVQGDQADRQVAILNATLGALKTRNEVLIKQIDAAIKMVELKNAKNDSNGRYAGRLATASSDDGSIDGASFEASAATRAVGAGGSNLPALGSDLGQERGSAGQAAGNMLVS
jgi:chaperonin GroES